MGAKMKIKVLLFISVSPILLVLSVSCSPPTPLPKTPTVMYTETPTNAPTIIYTPTQAPSATATVVSPPPASVCDIIINAGETIITEANKTTCLRGGSYVQQVNLSQNGAKLIAYPGETPVIDGENTLAPNWGALVHLTGNDTEIHNIEIRNSAGMCLVLSGENSLASHVDASHCAENGILIKGDYGVVEYSSVTDAAFSRQSGWSPCLSAARRPTGAIIRNNHVKDCGGEGISTYEAFGTLIEDNLIENNWNSAHIYISDAQDVIVRGNTIRDNEGFQAGLMLGDEVYNPPSKNILVENNYVEGTRRNFYWWQGVQGGGLDNVTIQNNTFVEASSAAGVQINLGDHVNSIFTNNTIIQTDGLPPFLNYGNLPGDNTIITTVQN